MKQFNTLFSILLFSCFLAFSANAQSGMYLKIPGVQGDSYDKGHEGQINVLAWSHAMSNDGKVRHDEMSLTTYLDKGTTQIMHKMNTGSAINEVTLYSTGITNFTYTLEDVRIRSHSTGGSNGDGKLTANITLSYNRIVVKNNKTGEKFTWNVLANRP